MGSGQQLGVGEFLVPTTLSPGKVIFLLLKSRKHQSSPEVLAYSQLGWCLVGETTAEEAWELLKSPAQESLFCEFHQLEV